MTHNELTEILREPRCDWREDAEIADRLDRYREELSRISQYYDATPDGDLYIVAGIADEALK